MSSFSSSLRGKTLPTEFFQRIKPGGLTLPISPGYTSPESEHTRSTSSTSQYPSWEAVSFLDFRSSNGSGVPIGLLPLPPLHVTLLHHMINQLYRCQTIVLVTSKETNTLITEACRRISHPGLVCTIHERTVDPWLIADYCCKSYRLNTDVYVWWKANLLFQYQFLWRPVLDHHKLVVFSTGDEKDVIAIGWQSSMNSKLPFMDELLKDGSAIYRHKNTQNTWNLEEIGEYFGFIKATIK